MHWTFERKLYGHRAGLDLASIRDFLSRGHFLIPRTLYRGVYRAVIRVGDHDAVYSRIAQPFPDMLTAQKPAGRFAMHFSGGFDSSILAALFDSPLADYIHVAGPESSKARALAARLKGRLHEIQISPDDFIAAAEELAPRLPEPYAYLDIIHAYIASRKAKELGHTLVVTGDGGDGIFGGAQEAPYSRKASMAWKSIDPNRALGLDTLQPFMHSGLYAWAKVALSPTDRGFSKRFAAQYCEELGLPDEIVHQRKGYWAGSIGMRHDESVRAHLRRAVDDSDYRWIREIRVRRSPAADLEFRLFGLVRWLEASYQPRLSAGECDDLLRQVSALNRIPEAGAGLGDRARLLVPPIAYPIGRRIGRFWRKFDTGLSGRTLSAVRGRDLGRLWRR